MAIEDIPLSDVPLLEAELDAVPAPEPIPEPAPGWGAETVADPVSDALPRRRPRAGANGASRPSTADPGPGRRRRRGEVETDDRTTGASSWMSAEIAARPGGRHARPGGHRDPDTGASRTPLDPDAGASRTPLDPEPQRNGSRGPLTDWRDTTHREYGHTGGDDLFNSPADAGERYRRNGTNGRHPGGDGPEPGTDEDPVTLFTDVADPGRHRHRRP
ncbi:hypothetical protein [Pseudonocardia sp. KRD291]|uniref:hypothetical protein n=1 Tax=Pseudonocardia sp. KRD291 TaxID=2792007 RepID=UPI001C4A4678|nr:hypothetical protein [Pseudonocardia sp. KRD291]MBW0103503.1 hypothetical protein [Pseudonocardia sp. KRD291]